MIVITTENVPIKMWLNDIEDGALQQAKDLANLPFTFKWVSIMPDSHQGYGMPIGGVLATKGVVIPNAVGVDIGCGMCAVKTNICVNSLEKKDITNVMNQIRERIPIGFNHHNEEQEWLYFDKAPDSEIISQQLEKAKYQLGTLGGGNHFIELQKDKEDFLWVMIHSGSRNFGLQIAKYYHEIAKKLCEKYYSNIPNFDLSFIPINTKEFEEYFNCMHFALEFAKENRLIMLNEVCESLKLINQELSFGKVINVHHNYARFENHFNENVIVHRKGATSAKKDEIGIIPGSQGTKSYIVKGLGNKESFMSCSHGAGRKMGRKQAQRELSLENEKDILDKQGIIHSIRSIDDLDEAPSAYKNIDIVMENQKDLVSIEYELTPIAVIKG